MASVKESVSVAMAAYNGEKYIQAQIQSILSQLGPEDEIVISVDPSNDRTIERIEAFGDQRIRWISGPGKGLIKNFENAIRQTKNDIVFLCDQDDLWDPKKVERVCAAMHDADLVLHDCEVTDASLHVLHPSFFQIHPPTACFRKNILKNSFMGCCMAFRKRLKKEILPFPDDLPMHDQWIGLVALKKGKVKILDRPLLSYRRHQENESSMDHASVLQMLAWRVHLLKALWKRGIL